MCNWLRAERMLGVPTAKEVMFLPHSDVFFLSVSRTRRGAAQRQQGR